jgi:hypothetical protein
MPLFDKAEGDDRPEEVSASDAGNSVTIIEDPVDS